MSDVPPVDWTPDEPITLANARSALYTLVPSFVPHALHRDDDHLGASAALRGELYRLTNWIIEGLDAGDPSRAVEAEPFLEQASAGAADDAAFADVLYDGALYVLQGESRRPILGRAGRALVAQQGGWVP